MSRAAGGSRAAATGTSSSAARVGVAAGIVGARLYHVITSWDEVPDEWWGAFAIWKGGLGVWGGIAAGCLVGGIVAKRAGADVWLLADCLAPGLLLAQGIGRSGNWWNQELYGKPTDLPGASRSTRHRSSRSRTTFHPTFLYELLWDFAAAAILVYVIERRFRPRPPGSSRPTSRCTALGRFFVELLRIDPAHEIAGLRLNAWMSLIGIVVGSSGTCSQRRGRPARPERPKPVVPKRKMAVPGERVRPTQLDSSSGRSGKVRAPLRAAVNASHAVVLGRAQTFEVRALPASSACSVPAGECGTGLPERPLMASAVRDLELDLDAFEGPFDLLLDPRPQGAARAGRDRHREHRRRVRRAPRPRVTRSTSTPAASSSS